MQFSKHRSGKENLKRDNRNYSNKTTQNVIRDNMKELNEETKELLRVFK